MNEIDVLRKDAGTWDAEMEIRPAPGVPSIKQRGVAEGRMVGGKWLVRDVKTESGFEGHGVYGWDAEKGKYTGSWVDSQQTTISRSEGTWSAETREMTFVVTARHQGKDITYREVTQSLDDATQVYRHFISTPAGEHEMITITYRRR